MIAMALANEPGLVIADEPTTALDVTIQAQVLEQLRELNRQSETAILLITHNMAVVASLCTWVVVMYAGRIVEQGPTDQIFQSPQHPYTWALLRSIPRIDTGRRGALLAISGTPPDLTDLPMGCKFSPRCRFSVEKCLSHEPGLIDVGPGHSSRCWIQMANVATSSRDDIDSPTLAHEVPRVALVSQPVDVKGSPRANALVAIREVSKDFPSGSLWVHAVDAVSLEIAEGETVGLVGESGSGKSTLGRVVAQLQPATRGDVFFDGRDLGQLRGEGLRQLRRRVQMIFQDPYSSLNPRMTVGAIIGEPLRNFGLARGAERTARVQEMMRICGLNPNFNNRYPHEFSGGQRQRVGIARSLILHPSFVVADEPISALDVSIQAQIINLLGELQKDLKLTYLFIAHDLAVVRHLSDRVAVMYLGILVEVAECGDLYANPLHPYTTSLLQAMPVPDPEAERRRAPIILQGEIPSPINPPSGCRFHTRCPIAEPICSAERPALVDYGSGHLAACHFPGKLQG
jgi:peptide/nickel transport system ATP-binding protein